MFQYALGRYIAEKKGYALSASPLPFPKTAEKISGLVISEPTLVCEGQDMDLEAILSIKDQAILLNGYFQKSNLYLPFWNQVREWYFIDISKPLVLSDISSEDLLLYLRLGDYYDIDITLSFQFYEAAIALSKARRLVIATDDPSNSYLDKFQKYNPIVLATNNPMLDLCVGRYFSKIAISCSTFSWWAAMLSNAEMIYFPIGKSALWSGCNSEPPALDTQDLRVDSHRFTYFYNCSIGVNSSYCKRCHPILDIKPELGGRHKHSHAYWFE